MDGRCLKKIKRLSGEFVAEPNKFVVDVFDRVIDLPAKIIAVRVKARCFGRADAAKPGKMQRESAGYAPVEAAEISVEKALLVKVDRQSALFSFLLGAKRAGRL